MSSLEKEHVVLPTSKQKEVLPLVPQKLLDLWKSKLEISICDGHEGEHVIMTGNFSTFENKIIFNWILSSKLYKEWENFGNTKTQFKFLIRKLGGIIEETASVYHISKNLDILEIDSVLGNLTVIPKYGPRIITKF